MLVPSRTVWTRQPQHNCRALQAGIGSGLTFLWTPLSQFTEQVNLRSATAGAGLNRTVGIGGVGGTNPSASDVTFNLRTARGASSTNYTVLAYVLHNGSGATQSPIDSDGTDRVFQLRLDGSVGQFIPFDTGGSFVAPTGAITAPTNRPVLLAGRVRNQEASVWLDGVKTTGASLGSTPATIAAANALVMVGARVGGGNQFGGQVYMAAHFGRALTDEELIELSRNPWQLFAATRRGIVVPAAGGTTIAGGIGTATASGLQASIAIKTAIAGGIGTAAASGLQASIALRTNIAAGIGTASASGLQASIALPTAIAAGIGTATASGLQATITVGSGITISGGIGTATASGLQASISAQTTIQGGIGAATASGLQATIGLRTPISGGIGTATASGLQATITFPTSITAGIGDATASGLPAGITFPAGGTIIFGVGSATASGLQALIREIGVSGGASVRGKKRGWANERAALEESLRQVDRIAEVMAESDEPQAQAIAEELEDYSGEVEQIELLRERLQALQAVQRSKELTAQKERDVREAARELKAILDDDEEIAEVLDSMLHIEFRALRMIGVM